MFKVQLGHPKIIQGSFAEFERVADVFAQLFRKEEESIYLFWNSIPLRFRYQQDLKKNFDNILAMVWLVEKEDEGATQLKLDNQILEIKLELRWRGDRLEVQPGFAEKSNIYTSYCQRLNRDSSLQLSRKGFIREWHTLIHQMVVSLEAGNIQIKDGTERRKLEMLQAVDKKIVGYGILYERTSDGDATKPIIKH